MKEIGYDRTKAVIYAMRWALSRNPKYYDYADLGGDCTSFVSQSVFAGCSVMNYTPDFGWYYINGNEKSPSWSGVQYFYNFITSNLSVGPYGFEDSLENLLPGDVIQLGKPDGRYYHSLVLTRTTYENGVKNYYICAHNNDAFMRNLNTYDYGSIRGIHIAGSRENT